MMTSVPVAAEFAASDGFRRECEMVTMDRCEELSLRLFVGLKGNGNEYLKRRTFFIPGFEHAVIVHVLVHRPKTFSNLCQSIQYRPRLLIVHLNTNDPACISNTLSSAPSSPSPPSPCGPEAEAGACHQAAEPPVGAAVEADPRRPVDPLHQAVVPLVAVAALVVVVVYVPATNPGLSHPEAASI